MGRRFVPFITLITLLSHLNVAISCPFCSAVTQTLRQEMSSMDAVVIAEAIETLEPSDSGEIELTVKVVIKGEDLVKPEQVVKTIYFGSAKKGRRFMLTGVDPPKLMWSAPQSVSAESEEYLSKVLHLPDNGLERLLFFQEYLEHEDTMLARDAYDEFAIAPYAEVQELGPKMHHDKLVAWIKDADVASDRRRLYLTMLGVAGDEKDVPMLEAMLRSTKKSTRAGLDALIACYLTLKGEEGLKVIDELFLANKKAEYADTYAAIMALRFHGTETDVILKETLVKSLHHVLERPQLADLVIPDLSRWNDWTQIDKMVDLFKSAEAGNNWVRVPVINYLRACPLPEADKALKEVTEIDPAAVRRANTFFPLPIASDNEPLEETSSINSDAGAQMVSVAKSNELLADASPTQHVIPAVIAPAAEEVNPFRILAVSAVTGTSLLILMWLVLSGGTLPART